MVLGAQRVQAPPASLMTRSAALPVPFTASWPASMAGPCKHLLSAWWMGLQKERVLRGAGVCFRCAARGPESLDLPAALWDEGGSVTGPTEAGQFPGRGDCTVPLGPVLRRAPCVVPCSAVTTLQFFIFEQGASYFQFTPWSHKFCSQCCPEDQHRPASKGGGHGGDQGLLLACRRSGTTCPEVWREGAGAEMGVCSCSQNAPPPPKSAG